MSGISSKISSYFGRFHYWKWVYLIRYKQQYGDSAMPIIHLYAGVMFAYMVVESHEHTRKQRVHDYHERKKHIEEVDRELWKEERDNFEINIPELEQSVYRARKGEVLKEFNLVNGQPPKHPPIVYRPINLPKKDSRTNDR